MQSFGTIESALQLTHTLQIKSCRALGLSKVHYNLPFIANKVMQSFGTIESALQLTIHCK